MLTKRNHFSALLENEQLLCESSCTFVLNDGIIILIRGKHRQGLLSTIAGECCKVYKIIKLALEGVGWRNCVLGRKSAWIFCSRHSCRGGHEGGGGCAHLSVCLCILLVICHQGLLALKWLLECLVWWMKPGILPKALRHCGLKTLSVISYFSYRSV